jgi:7,8-dihydroneopterin aldolase/epimerase/oxygenase
LPGTFTISVRDLKLYGYHGVYKAERVIGNWFLLDLSISLSAPEATVTSIDQTVNYVSIVELVKKEFSQPTSLLETLCMRIAEKLKAAFRTAENLSITITKLHAPIENFNGKVVVRYEWERE